MLVCSSRRTRQRSRLWHRFWLDRATLNLASHGLGFWRHAFSYDLSHLFHCPRRDSLDSALYLALLFANRVHPQTLFALSQFSLRICSSPACWWGVYFQSSTDPRVFRTSLSVTG